MSSGFSSPDRDFPGHHVLARINGLIKRNGFVRPALAELHQGFIYGDPHQPGIKFRIALEIVKVRVCLQERFLQDIFGIFFVLGDLLCHSENTAIVVIHQFRKGPGIAGFGAGD